MKLILKEQEHFENCLINKIIPNLDKKYSNSCKKEKLVHALDKGHTTAPLELKYLLLQFVFGLSPGQTDSQVDTSQRKFATCVRLAFHLATHLRGPATTCVDLH